MASLKEILKTGEDLIKIKSTKDNPLELERCAKYIVDFFAGTSLQVEHVVYNNMHSVIVTKGTKTPKVFLNGHFDVVEAEEGQFEPKYKGNKMYARGALDMKVSDATIMHLMREAADKIWDVGLLLTGDEEIGGYNGVLHLLKDEGYGCEVAVIPDGGFAIDVVVPKAKGIFHFMLEAKGESAHASRPWEGDNPIDKLFAFLQELKKEFLPLDKHPANHWVSTINVSRFESGSTYNHIPNRARAYCDVRFIEDETMESLAKKIKKMLPKDISMTIDVEGAVVNVSPDNPYLATYIDIIKEVTGKEVQLKLDFGTSDARHFALHHIPTITHQATGVGHHTKDEWIDTKSVEQYYEIVNKYLDKIAV